MRRVFWMHTDCMRPMPGAVFIFDDEQIEREQWGLKRLVFIHECLDEMAVEIHRGPTVETLLSLDAVIVTTNSPDPWIREQIRKLWELATVEVLPEPVFVELREPVDLRRFSQYWKRAERQLL